MTKKHFKLLAAALANTRPDKTWLSERDQWNRMVEAVMYVCRMSNNLFSESKFKEAVGWSE